MSSVIIISIVRLVALVDVRNVHSPDLDWNFALIGVWTETESNIAIVCGKPTRDCHNFFWLLIATLACLPSCRPILSWVLTGIPTPTQRSGYTSSKRTALSPPVKASQSQSSASYGGGDESSKVDDDQRLFVRLDEQEGSASQSTPGPPTSEIGSARSSITNMQPRNKTKSKTANWLSGKWSRDRTASTTHEDVEMQPPLARGGSINVRNDIDIRWTDSQTRLS